MREIFEASVRFGEFALCWKSATVVFIPKGDKDPGLLANRRPIRFINSMTKILQTIVKEETQEIFPANQFGFRVQLSATQQPMHLAEAIARAERPRRRSRECV